MAASKNISGSLQNQKVFVPGVSQKDWQNIDIGRNESFKQVFTIKQAPKKVEDKLPKSNPADVIDLVPSSCGTKYVGHTESSLCQCITKHRKAFECNYLGSSAIAKCGQRLDIFTRVREGVSNFGVTRTKTGFGSMALETISSPMEETVNLPLAAH